MEHQTLGRQVICPSKPANQRIMLWIAGFLDNLVKLDKGWLIIIPRSIVCNKYKDFILLNLSPLSGVKKNIDESHHSDSGGKWIQNYSAKLVKGGRFIWFIPDSRLLLWKRPSLLIGLRWNEIGGRPHCFYAFDGIIKT